MLGIDVGTTAHLDLACNRQNLGKAKRNSSYFITLVLDHGSEILTVDYSIDRKRNVSLPRFPFELDIVSDIFPRACFEDLSILIELILQTLDVCQNHCQNIHVFMCFLCTISGLKSKGQAMNQ